MLYDTLPPDFNKDRLVRLTAVKCTDSWPDWRITSFTRSCGDRTDQRPKYIDVCVARHNPNDASVHRLRFWRHGAISLMTCGEKVSLMDMDTMVMLGVSEHGGCKLCRDVVANIRAARGPQNVYQYGRIGGQFVTAWIHMQGFSPPTSHEHSGDRTPHNHPSKRVRDRMDRDDAIERMRNGHIRTMRLSRESVHSYYLGLLTEALRYDAGIVDAGYHKCLAVRLMDLDFHRDTLLCRAESGVTKTAYGRTRRSRWDKQLQVGVHIRTVRHLVAQGLLSVAGRVLGGIVERGDKRMVAWAIKWESPAAKTHWHQAVFVRDAKGAWTFDGWVRGGAR